MSQQQWGGPPRGGGGAGGSVRRARERMEAGLPPEIPPPPQQRPYEPPRQAPSPPSARSRPPMPQALQGQGPIGVAISRPTQVPQWPLAGTIETVQDQKSSQQYQPPGGRGAPPQRPPRPSHVPSMLDASRLQEHTPTFQYKPQDQSQGKGQRNPDDEITSPSVTSPMTQSSRPSTISSVGTIPDFPVPMPPPPPGPPRRSANLGPPPSSRRGASSYYSQASYVSPIPEESPRIQPSHESYASSAAIPTSWGSDSPGYQYEDEDEYDKYGRERGFGNDVIEEGRESRESNLDDSDDRGLIRSASLGKRAKPSMITTKGSEKAEQRPGPQPQQKSKLERMGVLEGGMAAGAALAATKPRDAPREPVWPMIGNPDSPLAGGTGFIDKSTSSSENEVPQVAKAITTDEPVPSGPGATAMLGAYNAASSLQPPGITPTRTPSPGFSRLSAIRRPPRLDIDAVRDAEARGSLTSLPDLIRRATRLAAMMDRGKRPASRLNDLNDFPSESDLAKDKEMGFSPDEKRQSGLSGMLAAFPPPGLATPTRGNTPTRPQSSWPVVDTSGSPQDPSKPKKRRRCCGLPCWGFLLVMLILLIIIAAAVVVPLELLVFHKPKTTSASTVTALEACAQNSATACQNGGTSSLSTGSCSCICINGFTGSTCSVAGSSGCTTTTISTEPTYTNVTLGDSIPRLISAAQTNFSIPLFGTVILARFNSANLSCVSENALVTFDGQSQRVGAADYVVVPTYTTSASAATATSNNKQRRDTSSSSSAAAAAATANGILYDPSSQYTSSDSTPSATSSAAASMASSYPNAVFSVTEEVLDFAR